MEYLEHLEKVRFDLLFHNRYGGDRRLCVLHIGAIMSAIMLSLISVATMLVSFGIMLYLVCHRKYRGFDGLVLAVVLVMFMATAGSSTLLGAYGYNTLRNGGHNGAGLSLSRD